MIAVAPCVDGAFPYDNPVIGIVYTSLAIELANALDAIGTPYFRARASDYLAARRTFKGLLKPAVFSDFEMRCRKHAAPPVPAPFLVRRLLRASLSQDREAAIEILGAGEALLVRNSGLA